MQNFNKDFDKEYTFIEALAEIYNFNPKKKKDSQIIFEATDKDDPKWLRFGKNYSSLFHDWSFIEWAKNCPTLGCEEKHFVSNLMCNSFAKNQMIYGAQQGTFKIKKIYDSRIDTDWHNKEKKSIS